MSKTPKTESTDATKSFDWFAGLGRDGLRTRYRPRSRIYSFFLAVVPWLDLIVLTMAVVLLTRAMAVVPGFIVDLPRLPSEEGVQSTLAIVARAIEPTGDQAETAYVSDDGATVKPVDVMVFFDDERFNLSQPHHIATFRNAVRAMLARTGETQVLLYLDRAVTHENSMRLALLLRHAGVDRVNFVMQEP